MWVNLLSLSLSRTMPEACTQAQVDSRHVRARWIPMSLAWYKYLQTATNRGRQQSRGMYARYWETVCPPFVSQCQFHLLCVRSWHWIPNRRGIQATSTPSAGQGQGDSRLHVVDAGPPYAADAGHRARRHRVAEATRRLMKSSFCSGFQKGLRCISATEAATAGARGWSGGTSAAFLSSLAFSSCAACGACSLTASPPRTTHSAWSEVIPQGACTRWKCASTSFPHPAPYWSVKWWGN